MRVYTKSDLVFEMTVAEAIEAGFINAAAYNNTHTKVQNKPTAKKPSKTNRDWRTRKFHTEVPLDEFNSMKELITHDFINMGDPEVNMNVAGTVRGLFPDDWTGKFVALIPIDQIFNFRATCTHVFWRGRGSKQPEGNRIRSKLKIVCVNKETAQAIMECEVSRS